MFLETVCPGTPFLDENIHFSLTDASGDKLSEIDDLAWPLTTSASTNVRARIERTYLNVARPPFVHDIRRNIESTTYVPLPYHISTIFAQVCSATESVKDIDEIQVGANVNPLMQDPFKLVHLNPGCFSSMIVMRSLSRDNRPVFREPRSPFNKMTTSINKLLRMGAADDSDHPKSRFVPLLDVFKEEGSSLHLSHTLGNLSGGTSPSRSKSSAIFDKLLNYDEKDYMAQIKSPSTSKLLVAANVNVLNVFALNEHYAYSNTKTNVSTKSIFPLRDLLVEDTGGQQNPPVPTTTTCKPYKKVTETPILRLQFKSNIIVTSMITLQDETAVILGFNTGAVVMIHLIDMSYRHFDLLGSKECSDSESHPSTVNSVTSLCAIWHARYPLLVVVGFANGEVIILDPEAGSDSLHLFQKEVVGKDTFVTYFKKFDLSPLHNGESHETEDVSPQYIVGHFKVSHKAVTSIASTMAYDLPSHSSRNPQLLAIACEDGLVRFIDLISTHGQNYGDTSNFYNKLIVSDIVSNYFQDGIRSVEFSPDFRFFVLAGKGDLIEVFRMTYYNINGLLQKNTEGGHRPGRSRSGTVNSGNLTANPSLFLASSGITPAASIDTTRDEHHDTHYPPAIKDITIVSRLKGHTNTVDRVAFIHNDNLISSSIENGNSQTYKLISCGGDGKVILWDFDSKALSRVKKSHITTKKRVSAQPETTVPLLPAPNRGKVLASPTISKNHHRNRSTSHQSDDNVLTSSFSALGINKLLSQSPQPLQHLENAEEHLKIVFSLYRSLFEVRLKKHYGLVQTKDLRKKYSSIIYAVVDDKTIPSIQIPLLSIDMSCVIADGKILSFHLNPLNFWVFGRNGDIFKYKLGPVV